MPVVSLEVDAFQCESGVSCLKDVSRHLHWAPAGMLAAGPRSSGRSYPQRRLLPRARCASSSVPCADNTITVTMKLTVPLYHACGTNLTVAGLSGMATPDEAVSDSGLSFQSSDNLQFASWTKGQGELVVTVTGDESEDSDGLTQVSFSFVVENPAVGQEARRYRGASTTLTRMPAPAPRVGPHTR